MQTKRLKNKDFFIEFIKDKFAFYTCLLSLILSFLYVWKGYKDEFTALSIVYIILNFLYTPVILIFGKKSFQYFELIYAIFNIFFIAFQNTLLYNNYSAFFVICIIILINPSWKYFCASVYLIAASVAFALNDELIYHYLIHICRSTWFFGVVEYIINVKYDRKKVELKTLVLTDDEISILKEMKSGKKQKEVECFSINTVTKKLKDARIRNNIGTTTELLYKFINEC